jgi:hypothetical protein
MCHQDFGGTCHNFTRINVKVTIKDKASFRWIRPAGIATTVPKYLARNSNKELYNSNNSSHVQAPAAMSWKQHPARILHDAG